MNWKDKRVGFAMTGSFCTFERVMPQIAMLVSLGAQVTPILSESVRLTDTRFGRAVEWIDRLKIVTGRLPWFTLNDVEPIGPRRLLDLMIVAPCTGNTLAKLATGIADTAVTMGVKSHLRNDGPVLLAVSTNDGLGRSAKNIGKLLNEKHMYFVPFGQDDPMGKPRSLVACVEMIPEAAEAALEGRQLQPILSY